MPPRSDVELYVDGGARGNPGPAACAFVLRKDDRTIDSRGFFLGETTNNVAEYTGLIRGLEAAREHGIRELHVFSDSELMVKQIIGEYRVRSNELQILFEKVQVLLLAFDRWQIRHIRREDNAEADRLVNEVLDKGHNGFRKPKAAVAETVPEPSPEKSAPQAPAAPPAKVLVELAAEPPPNACPAGLRKGQSFVFTEFVPAGLCVHAALAILPAVVALQREGTVADGTLTVRCSHPGCRATFNLSVI